MVFTDTPPSVFGEYLAVLVMAYSVAEGLDLSRAVLGGLILVLGVVAHDWNSEEFDGLGGLASDLAIPVVVFGLGRVVRLQRSRAEHSDHHAAELERDRMQLAREAVAAERAHMARELHDVVTHSLSMLVIQAQGAQRVLDGENQQVRQALESIESGGRGALADMRRLLGLLRAEGDGPERDPQPVLSELPDLVARVRAAGLPVTLTVSGSVEGVTGAIGLSAYRIVQEALTNALTYAGDAPTRVSVGCFENGLDVVVEDDGHGGVHSHGSGRGLIGMRERVTLYRGTLEAGARPDGGYRVHAWFPLEAE
jgi:signal transduction histidine kinase